MRHVSAVIKKNEERGVGVLNHLVYIEYSEKILKQKKIANKQIHKQIFSRIKTFPYILNTNIYLNHSNTTPLAVKQAEIMFTESLFMVNI